MSAILPKVMVLQYEESLHLSVWKDYYTHCRTLPKLLNHLREGVKKRRFLGYRLIAVHAEVVGVQEPGDHRKTIEEVSAKMNFLPNLDAQFNKMLKIVKRKGCGPIVAKMPKLKKIRKKYKHLAKRKKAPQLRFRDGAS